MFCKAKSAKKKILRGDFRSLPIKNVQMWDHFFPLLFPQGLWISKNIGHPTSGSGGKNTFKLYLKSEHTHTHKHTNIWTFRLIESIGPEGQCFENPTYGRHWISRPMRIVAPIHFYSFFKALALWADAFYKSKCPYVCVFVYLLVCSLLRYRLTVFLPPLPEVQCPNFSDIRNPWANLMERSGLRFEHFCVEVV